MGILCLAKVTRLGRAYVVYNPVHQSSNLQGLGAILTPSLQLTDQYYLKVCNLSVCLKNCTHL
jgi:hypothetical protein